MAKRFLIIGILLLNFRCGQSWGKFWTLDSGSPAGAALPCASAVAADTLPMVCAPANTQGFLMGSNAVGGASVPEHTVSSITAFAISRYEVKYADWLSVRTWAESNTYVFANPGVQGESGAGTNQHPVTTINWRDAMVWCNAASQKSGLIPVYYTDSGLSAVLKISTNAGSLNATLGSEDNPYVKWSANGYRLPTEAEWEYAARYVDGVTFMRGDAPSGWTDNNPANTAVDTAEINAVAWYSVNSGSATHAVGASPGNALGIFDMSGNVWEWIWDWYVAAYSTSSPYTDADSQGAASGGSRVLRGGSYVDATTDLRASARSSNFFPWQANQNMGFRPVRRP